MKYNDITLLDTPWICFIYSLNMEEKHSYFFSESLSWFIIQFRSFDAIKRIILVANGYWLLTIFSIASKYLLYLKQFWTQKSFSLKLFSEEFTYNVVAFME